jgi:hypothetical protein
MPTLPALLANGVVGTYTHFEATEVFATKDGDKAAFNVFTILVAEDRLSEVPQPLTCLNPSRIKLKSLPGWAFGIARYIRPIADLMPALAAMAETGEWSASGKALRVGKLHEVPQQFVQPDSMTAVPWNKVLKNNFWNGSHIFEWSDRDKKVFQPFFDDTRRIQELSARITEFVPMTLAGLSDRLGNVAVQLPVTVVMSEFQKLRPTGAFTVELAWRANVPPRPLRASCELEFDGIVSGYASAAIQGPKTVLPIPPGRGTHRGIIWDDLNQAILAVTGPGAFINSIALNIQTLNPEPRTFSIKQSDGSVRPYKIGLTNRNTTIVGDRTVDENGSHTRKRMYNDQVDRLAVERVFVQYKPEPGQQDAEHEKALHDLRTLITTHGQEGAWLWDPYLNARDILETLFHCPHAGSDLRALTAAREPPTDAAPLESGGQPTSKQDFAERQRTALDTRQSNWLGLRLEYRVSG